MWYWGRYRGNLNLGYICRKRHTHTHTPATTCIPPPAHTYSPKPWRSLYMSQGLFVQGIPVWRLPSTLKNFPPPADQAVPPSMHLQSRETGLCLLYRVCLDSTVSIQQWSQVLSPKFVVGLYTRLFEVPGSWANIHWDAAFPLCADAAQSQLESGQLALCSALTGQSQDNKPSIFCGCWSLGERQEQVTS